jgi:hypothetical protein
VVEAPGLAFKNSEPRLDEYPISPCHTHACNPEAQATSRTNGRGRPALAGDRDIVGEHASKTEVHRNPIGWRYLNDKHFERLTIDCRPDVVLFTVNFDFVSLTVTS